MKPTPLISFRVDGVCQSRGSKKPITVPGLRRGLLVDSNPKSVDWMNLIKVYASAAMAGRELFDGALVLRVVFYRQRPKGHFRKDGSVKPSAPAFPDTKPDCSKLMRAAEDALSGVVYVDDARLADSWPSKRFGKPGCVISLYRLPATMAEWKEAFDPLAEAVS
jgi:Holliday junction resolvase RusA-like endonuclease